MGYSRPIDLLEWLLALPLGVAVKFALIGDDDDDVADDYDGQFGCNQ